MEESSFKFLGYRIPEISFRLSDTYGKTQESLVQEINVENNFHQSKARFVEVVLNITVKTESENLYLFLKIKGGFQAEETMPEELFQITARQNAPAILFPFARSIITSYTALVNIPPIILPTINFVNPPKGE